MSEWQPARVRPAHKQSIDKSLWCECDIQRILRSIVRVKEGAFPSPAFLADYRSRGCDSIRFFRVHPEDIHGYQGQAIVIVCEHEILTD